jgi:hypothetical protein
MTGKNAMGKPINIIPGFPEIIGLRIGKRRPSKAII